MDLINWLPIAHLSARLYFHFFLSSLFAGNHFQYSTYPINIYLFLTLIAIWCSLNCNYCGCRINICLSSTGCKNISRITQYLPKQHLTRLNLTNQIIIIGRMKFLLCAKDCCAHFSSSISILAWWARSDPSI